MIRIAKFLFITAPFVVIYFLAIVFFTVSIIDSEVGTLLEKILVAVVAIASVAIVTWSAGFWGSWKFPILFTLLPILIFIDFTISSVIGIKPMILTLLAVLVYSVSMTLKEKAHNQSLQSDAPEARR